MSLQIVAREMYLTVYTYNGRYFLTGYELNELGQSHAGRDDQLYEFSIERIRGIVQKAEYYEPEIEYEIKTKSISRDEVMRKLYNPNQRTTTSNYDIDRMSYGDARRFLLDSIEKDRNRNYDSMKPNFSSTSSQPSFDDDRRQYGEYHNGIDVFVGDPDLFPSVIWPGLLSYDFDEKKVTYLCGGETYEININGAVVAPNGNTVGQVSPRDIKSVIGFAMGNAVDQDLSTGRGRR